MANPNDKLRRLYQNGLKHFDLPDFDTFQQDMMDEAKRKRFYTNMQDAYDLPDFDTFSKDIGAVAAPTPAPAQPAAQPQQTTRTVMPVTDNTAQQAAATPAVQAAMLSPMQKAGFMMQADAMNAKRVQHQNAFNQRMEDIKKGNKPGAFMGESEFNPETGKMEKHYYTTQGDRVSTQMEQSQRNTAHHQWWENHTEEGRNSKERRLKREFDEQLSSLWSRHNPEKGENAAEQAWSAAEARQKAAQNQNANDIYRDRGSFLANLASLGGRENHIMNAAELGRRNQIAHFTNFDLDRLMNDAWANLGEEGQKSLVDDCYKMLRRRNPGSDELTLYNQAKEFARRQSDLRLYNLAVEKNLPQSNLEYLMRKIGDMNVLLNINKGLAVSSAGTTGDMAAYEAANEQYRQDGHKVLDVTGMVAGFALDPTTWLSAGFGSAATKGAMWAGGRWLAGRGASTAVTQAATRKFATSMTGRVVAGIAGGAANFGTFEGIKEVENQFAHGGHIVGQDEVGRYINEGYSAGAVAGQFGHGLMMGGAVGWLGPVSGNVSDKLVSSTSSTLGKVATSAGVYTGATMAEGTIFSVPEWIEGDRDAFDVWTDNMAMMAGFKAKHVIKSAGSVLGDLKASFDSPTNGRKNRLDFESRLRQRMDAPSDGGLPNEPSSEGLRLTKDEKAELERYGYDLRDLVESAERTGDASKGSLIAENAPEIVSRLTEMVGDTRISEAARAKMYYYATGRKLPMSTVMRGELIEDGEGGYIVESQGANGVITSRSFKSRKAAYLELERINRQTELNSIEIGERYQQYTDFDKRLQDASRKVAAENGWDMVEVYRTCEEARRNFVRGGDKQFDEVQQNILRKVTEAIGEFEETGVTDAMRGAINEKYGVDIDAAIRKEANRRTQAEQTAIDEYIKELLPEKVKENPVEDADAEDITNQKWLTDETEAPADEFGGGEPIDPRFDSKVEYDNPQPNGEQKPVGRAVMKYQDRPVEVLSGRVVMTEDGKMVDNELSDASIVIRDVATGRVEMVSPEAILSYEHYAQEETAEAAPNTPEASADAPDEAQPKYTSGKIKIRNSDGTETRGVLTGYIDENGNHEYYVEGDLQRLHYASEHELDNILADYKPDAPTEPAAPSDVPSGNGEMYDYTIREYSAKSDEEVEKGLAVMREAEANGSITPAGREMLQALENIQQERTASTAVPIAEESVPADKMTVTTVKPQLVTPLYEEEATESEVQQSAQSTREIPVRQNGKHTEVLYHEVPIARTLEELYDGSFSQQEVDDFVNAHIEESTKRAEQIAKKAPAISTNKTEYLEKRRKWQEALADARKRQEYWTQVAKEVTRITARGNDSETAEDNPDVTESEPRDGMEFASTFFGGRNGLRITPESFRSETGFSAGDQKGMAGIIASHENGGMSIERAAEILMENGGEQFFIDSHEARNTIIEMLSDGNPRGYIARRRKEDAQLEQRAMQEAEEQFYMEAYGMSKDEYQAYEERLIPSFIEKFAGFDYDAYYDELNKENNSIENGTGKEHVSQGYGIEDGGIREILPGERIDEVRGAKPRMEPGGSIERRGESSDTEAEISGKSGAAISGKSGEPTSAGTEPSDRGGRVTDDSGRENAESDGKSLRTSAGVDEATRGESLRINPEEADRLLSVMEREAETVADIELSATSWAQTFDKDGKIVTPIGKVKMDGNQATKFFEKGREKEFGMVGPTLSNPDVIINEPSEAKDGNTERASSFLFIKTFNRDGKKIKFYASITVSQDGLEVSISSHYMNRNKIARSLSENEVVYIKGTLLSNSSEWRLAEHQNDVPDLLPTQESNVSKSKEDNRQATIEQPTEADTETQDAKLSGTSTSSRLNTAPLSAGKDNTISSEKQEDSEKTTLGERIAVASEDVNTEPTEAQKEAGNYKKGHVQVGSFDVTIEQPVGSVRRGKDANGKEWESEMHHTYGYIRGTEGVDGDHIDVFISADVDGWNGRKAFVVDQYNPDGSFDEHKVMLGFNDKDEAFNAYLSNYEKGWENGRRLDVTEVNIEDFEKWIDSSKRKTKAFTEYKGVKSVGSSKTETTTPAAVVSGEGYKVEPKPYTNRQGKTLDTYLVTIDRDFSKEEISALRAKVKELKGWYDSKSKGWMLRSVEDAKAFAEDVIGKTEDEVADQAPLSMADMDAQVKKVDLGGVVDAFKTKGETKLSDPATPVEPTEQPKPKKKSKWISDEDAAEFDSLRDGLRNHFGKGDMVNEEGASYGKPQPKQMDAEVLRMGTRLTYLMMKGGLRSFSDYCEAMKDELPDIFDDMRPHLKSLYAAAQNMEEVMQLGWDEEMDDRKTVKSFDVYNFDKPGAKDIIATAQHTVDENASQQQTEQIIQTLKDQRNEQRKKDADETSADTEAISDKAEATASEVESQLETATTEQDAERLSRSLDQEIEDVNKQLALLGYYEADEVDRDFNEALGYSRNAERKATQDAHRLATQLASDLGLTVDPKDKVKKEKKGYGFSSKIARSNVAPAGGEVYITLPLGENRVLSIWVVLDRNYPGIKGGRADRVEDDLLVSNIMFRVEDSTKGGMSRYLTTNNYLSPDVTYDDMLASIRRTVRHYLPDEQVRPATPLAPQPGEDIVQMAERVAKDSEAKKPTIAPEQPIGDLFSLLFEKDTPAETPKAQSTTSKPKTNEKTNVQTRTEEPGRGGQQPRLNEPVGKSAEHETERTDRGGVAERSGVHTVSDTERGTGVSELHKGERGIKNARNNHAERGVDYAPKGEKARIDANLAAIELAKKLLASGATATPKEMEVLRRYSGWGGLGAAFNEGKAWSPNPINKRMRELLTPEEYSAAEMSRNSAYYTPAPVIDAMWDIAKALGFKGGNIVEGSAGIGNILGLMPADISKRSDIHAVEIDDATGSILSLLYPDAQVDIQGFEQTRIANGTVDLAITNVPFIPGLHVMDDSGDIDLSKKFRDIHDFCIAKNVRKLREGGIGIFITTKSSLDSSQKLRNWLVADKEGNADVVGVFRMNNQTFGGTPATSDIIVVRKRVNGRKSINAIDVSTVTAARTASFEDDRGKTKDLPLLVNRYFIEHPEYMGGEMFFGFEQGDTYRPTSMGLFPTRTADQTARMEAWVKHLTEMDWSKEQGVSAAPQAQQINEALGEGVKEGSMVTDKDGNLCVARMGRAVPLSLNKNKIKGRTKEECFKDYTEIKDALAEVLKYQTEHDDDAGLKPMLGRLNKAYDTFVQRYGNLNKNNNLAWLRNDVDFSSIVALETYSEKGGKDGKKIKTYGKTDIFSRRVVEMESEPSPKNVKDGIIASLYKYGRIDTEYLAAQLGKTKEEIKQEIVSSGLGFENPQNGQMEVSYEYLSGNVREKLRQAQEANAANGGGYDANVRALEAVIPMNIPAHLIEFTLGSSWIDPKLYERFINERTGLDITLTNVGGTWHMKEPYYTNEPKNMEMGVRSEKLGIFIPGHKIIEAAITNKTITVSKTSKNYDGTTTTETDPAATTACATKVDEIRQDFKEWARAQMQNDPDLSMHMEEVYNEQFNNSVPKTIPDEFVPEHFGGAATMVGGRPFKLRPHQAKAVIRATTQPVLLAHEVGTGKTYTLITTAMEMRRLGTARKPMIVVQNATVGQFVASAKALYPNAKVLTLEDADRNAEGRRAFYAKIKFNDWDMIVVPQSVFERIPDSVERQTQFIQDKIEEKLMVLEQMRDADPNGRSQIVRSAEREIASLENEIAQLANGGTTGKKKEKDAKKAAITRQNAAVRAKELLDRATDDVEDFDSMGIDAILVDEAHEYKHLGFATAMQRGVKGVDPSPSKKSQGVFLKAQAVLEKTGGKNVVFATGTPISNTAAEIWTFMRYLMPADVMKDYGIYYFDDFVRNFGNLQQMLEFTTSGKYKENNRFAGYVNLPELVRIWSTVADTVLTRDAGGVSDKIPQMEGGKAQDIFLPQTRALRSIMKYVKSELDRYEEMTGKEKKENSHIPLVMYGIAKAAAVDARLVQRDAEDDPNSKTNEAVRQTLHTLEATKDYKGTVAIFADNYQNKTSGFNLYEDIRKKLIEAGVPEGQIVVMKSGMTVNKKLEIFDRVNSGEVRVIMGSTFTLGTGVNIQERLHTLIHLDAPNRPMDYTQRNGRILRQGNLHNEWGMPVRVLRFGVEDSLDVTAYQRLKTKGAIADSIMNGKQLMDNSMENRSLEEEQDLFGDITAQLSGSEYALLKNQIEKEVRKLSAQQKNWEADQTYIHNRKRQISGQNKDAELRIADNKAYLDKVEAATVGEITVGKHSYATARDMEDFFTEQNKRKAELQEKVRTSGYMSSPATSDITISVGGFDFKVHTEVSKETKRSAQGDLFASAPAKMTYSCPELGIEDTPVEKNLIKNAVADIMENVVSGKDFRERIEVAQRSIERNNAELQSMLAREGVPFQHAEELDKAQEKLAEYEELMKQEMEAKEAKYADLDKEVSAAYNIELTEEESEDTTSELGIEYSAESSKFASRYETADGKTVNYTSENPEAYSVSEARPDGGSHEVNSGSGAELLQRQGDTLRAERNGGLNAKRGEFCLVERVFTENGTFNFTSGERIESADDVAFLFSALEDAAKEHSFVVYVKDGRPTVVELGMGTFTSTMVDIPTAALAYNRIKPDKVYFVHNHPSGNLKCSVQDVQMLQKIEGISDVPVFGVIINLKTGKYGTFDTENNLGESRKRIPDTEQRLTVHTLDKQIFSPGYDPMAQPLVRSSQDVAQFLNSHRMGDRAKVSFLILSRANRIIGNIHTPFTEISTNAKEVARYISERVIQFGGDSAILYGDFPMSRAEGIDYRQLKDLLKQVGGSNLLDVVSVEGNHTRSANDDGLLYEPGTEYGKANDGELPFRLGDGHAAFNPRRDKAIAEHGSVMPGLNDSYVSVVKVPLHDFTGDKPIEQARTWAKENIVGDHQMDNGTRYTISNVTVNKYLSNSAVGKSENLGVHLSVLKQLPEVINASIDAEVHPDYKKGAYGGRSVKNGIGNTDMLVHRLYGAVNIDGATYRVKTTLHEYSPSVKENTAPHSFEVTKIEVLEEPNTSDGAQDAALNNKIGPLGTAKLLKGVEKSYDKGKKLLEESRPTTASGEIRYREVEDDAVLTEFAEGKTVKAYRTMQVIDGKLYSPMATKVGGKTTPEIKLGVPEQSEEHPEIIKGTKVGRDGVEQGYVVIDKGLGKGSLTVAYNPYAHTSRTVLNDQFSSAYIRPNLVTVEVEVPQSELTSGYRAPMAKNAVGEISWHSGSVSGQLADLGKPRRVILTRYDKPVRIVPYKEVAQMIAEQLDGTDIAIPYNVVQPQLRTELERLGITISEEATGSIGEEPDFGRAEYVTDQEIERINAHQQEMAQTSPEAKSSHAEKLAKKLNTPIRIVNDAKELTSNNAEIQARMRKSKGFYDPATGKVVVVLPNNANVEDVAETVFHEVVAHKGLRELVGEENYDAFCDEVYDHLKDDLKDEVNRETTRRFKREPEKGYEHLRRVSVDEMFGRMAEKGFEDFTKAERGIWAKLKAKVLDAINKFLGSLKLPKWVKLGDNELRYMLWRSHEKLRGKVDLVDMARDAAKREELSLNKNDQIMRDSEDANVVKAARILRELEPERIAAGEKMPRNRESAQVAYKNIGRVKNERDGREVEFYISAFKKNHRLGGVFEKTIPMLGRAFKNSVPIYSETDNLGGTKRPDGTEHRAHPNISAYHNYVGKVEIDGNPYYVRYTVTEEKAERNGLHSAFVTDVALYEQPREGQTIPNSFRSNDPNGVIDAKLANFFERAKIAEEKLLNNNDLRYRRLTQIEKGKLIDSLNAFSNGVAENKLSHTGYKGTTLESLLQVNDEINLRYRDSETGDIWKDQSVGLQERITNAALRLSNNQSGDLTLRNDAMRAVVSNLQSLVHDMRNRGGVARSFARSDRRAEAGVTDAMNVQAMYDRTTVKRITDLARVLMQNGYLSGITSGEVQRLLSAVKNATAMHDISDSVQKIMDIMVNTQLRNGEAAFRQLLTLRASKVDARGVEVQGVLDVDGQRTLEVVKKAISLTEDDLTDRIAEANNRMSDPDQTIADQATLEYAGLNMALEYVQNIANSKAEEKSLRDSIKTAAEDKQAGRMTTDAYNQFVEATEDAIRKNKIERTEAYFNLVGRLSDSLRESIENAKAFREAEKARIGEIHHNANSDMEGRPSNEHHKDDWKDKFVNNGFVQFLFAPLGTFDQILRVFGNKSANGEGYLWNRFMRGWVDCRNKELTGVKEKFARLDEKAAEIFGRGKTWGDIIRMERKLPKATVSFWDGGEMRDHELTQGNLLYIYMVDKMTDGRMKLRRMGITEDDIANIENFLDPRFKALGDWLQDEFLVATRNEYNETHKRMFGASMAAIENYFPLKILANARVDKEEDVNQQNRPDGITTKTGSIIKRRTNNLALDITGADALSVILDHVTQMEHWSAYAEWNRDLNTLRTYKRFRNQVINMTTVYGGGRELWDKFNDLCLMAAGEYRPPISKLNKNAVNIAKGVTAAKVSFRLFTALKQFLSAPAYASEVDIASIAKSLANPYGDFKWCMENLPIFNERWSSRISGDPRLLKSDMDWKMWRSRIMELSSRVGMTPNAFVDALTVSIGARAMYNTRMKQYLREGYAAEAAEEKAKQDATILFNQTQQSAESPFLSTMQVDKDWLSSMLTVFRNSPMSYTRQAYDALRNLKRNLTPGQKAESVAFMTKQILRDWDVDPDNATDEERAKAENAAKKRFSKQLMKDVIRVAVFGFGLEFLWNLGPYLPYLIFGNNDDEKDKMWDDALTHAYFGSVEGLTGGDLMSSFGNMAASGEWNRYQLNKDMPLASDINSILDEFSYGKKAAGINDVINLIVQMGVGINPQSITDAVVAITDACGDDPALSHEAAIFAMRVLQVPQSQIDKMYFDEVDLTGEEASKLTPVQLAQRYAEYKVKRGTPLAPWSWGDEERLGKYKKLATDRMKERLDAQGDSKVIEAYADFEARYKAVSKKVKEADALKETDYVAYAQAQVALKQDPDFILYQQFGSLDKQLGRISKMWLSAKTPEEASLIASTISSYRAGMVKVLQADNVESQQAAMSELFSLQNEFYSTYPAMQPQQVNR